MHFQRKLLQGSGPHSGNSSPGQAELCPLSVTTPSDRPSDTFQAEDCSRESLCHHVQEGKVKGSDSQGHDLVPFHPPSPWQEHESASSLSSHSTPDQFSVQDSGKGDSEFNDSASDISGEGLKKPPSQVAEKQVGNLAHIKGAHLQKVLFPYFMVSQAEHPKIGTAACMAGRTYKDTERYCSLYAHQSQRSKTIPLHCESDYVIAYSTTPIYQPMVQLEKSHFLPQKLIFLKLKDYKVCMKEF
nr:uncharacterized protein LOC102455952 [Pelodiscus sinensis]|eukprot:XP_006119436.1 uncharacterized protein LOC102455952 [Pelodiscus sinensis]